MYICASMKLQLKQCSRRSSKNGFERVIDWPILGPTPEVIRHALIWHVRRASRSEHSINMRSNLAVSRIGGTTKTPRNNKE
jgi:hypothetical protein